MARGKKTDLIKTDFWVGEEARQELFCPPFSSLVGGKLPNLGRGGKNAQKTARGRRGENRGKN